MNDNHERCIYVPDGFADLSDERLAEFVRTAIEIRQRKRLLALQERERNERWWQIYRSLSFWQRFKVHVGLLKF